MIEYNLLPNAIELLRKMYEPVNYLIMPKVTHYFTNYRGVAYNKIMRNRKRLRQIKEHKYGKKRQRKYGLPVALPLSYQ
jgi:hypothetical protein